jgi:hypothetical protein
MMWIGFIWIGMQEMTGACKHANKDSVLCAVTLNTVFRLIRKIARNDY